MLDEISGLNGTGKLLIVGRGVLHAFKLRAVQADTLSNLVDGLAAVFTPQKHIHINAFTGVDEGGHPSGADLIRVSVSFDIQEGVVESVHNDVVAMRQVDAAGCDKMRHTDMWDRIDTDDLVFRCHRV